MVRHFGIFKSVVSQIWIRRSSVQQSIEKMIHPSEGW